MTMSIGPLRGANTAKLNEVLPIKRVHVELPKFPLQHEQRCSLGAERGLAHLSHIVDMKINEVTEGFQTVNT